jgi:hypothetical protein
MSHGSYCLVFPFEHLTVLNFYRKTVGVNFSQDRSIYEKEAIARISVLVIFVSAMNYCVYNAGN